MQLLDRDGCRSVLHFRSRAGRPPVCWSHSYQQATISRYGEAIPRLREQYQDDILFAGQMIEMYEAPEDDPSYRWAFGDRVAPRDASMEEQAIIRDWSELPPFLAAFPDPCYHGFTAALQAARAAHPESYILANWHLYFNGLLIYLRGLQHLCADFYDAPDELRAVCDRLLEFFRMRARLSAQAGADGVWGGEDVAGQTRLIMRPQTFRRFYGPYYRALGGILHEEGLDYWWHSDGALTPILDDLISYGVDVVHPLQAGCHDDAQIAAGYGGRIAFWAGMDVQQVMPFGRPQDVYEHVRQRRRDLGRSDGGLVVGPGNTIGPEVPLENLIAYHEALREPLC
jgi:uroporphyrinogen decarboxylase